MTYSSELLETTDRPFLENLNGKSGSFSRDLSENLQTHGTDGWLTDRHLAGKDYLANSTADCGACVKENCAVQCHRTLLPQSAHKFRHRCL
jgi:hypothetical protein